MEVEAGSDDEAMAQLLPMAKEHLGAKHSEMANLSDDEIKNMIMSGWSKDEGAAAPAEGM
jgi:hypothetical protein